MSPMRVLLAVDFSSVSERTVRECAGRAWPAGTIIRVLGVVEKIPPSAAELWHDAEGSLEGVLQLRKIQIEELVRKNARALQNKGLTTETSVRTGRRRKTVAEEAKSWQADVVVDAAHGMPSL